MWARRRWDEAGCAAPGTADLHGLTVTFDAPHVGALRYVLVEVFDADGTSLHRQLLEPGTDLHVAGRVLRIRDLTDAWVGYRVAVTTGVLAA